MAEGGSSPKGAVGGGIGFTSGGVGDVPVTDDGQEGRGVRVALVPCLRRRKGGEERGERRRGGALLKWHGRAGERAVRNSHVATGSGGGIWWPRLYYLY
jgi:hypothetical protein